MKLANLVMCLKASLVVLFSIMDSTYAKAASSCTLGNSGQLEIQIINAVSVDYDDSDYDNIGPRPSYVEDIKQHINFYKKECPHLVLDESQITNIYKSTLSLMYRTGDANDLRELTQVLTNRGADPTELLKFQQNIVDKKLTPDQFFNMAAQLSSDNFFAFVHSYDWATYIDKDPVMANRFAQLALQKAKSMNDFLKFMGSNYTATELVLRSPLIFQVLQSIQNVSYQSLDEYQVCALLRVTQFVSQQGTTQQKAALTQRAREFSSLYNYAKQNIGRRASCYLGQNYGSKFFDEASDFGLKLIYSTQNQAQVMKSGSTTTSTSSVFCSRSDLDKHIKSASFESQGAGFLSSRIDSRGCQVTITLVDNPRTKLTELRLSVVLPDGRRGAWRFERAQVPLNMKEFQQLTSQALVSENNNLFQ